MKRLLVTLAAIAALTAVGFSVYAQAPAVKKPVFNIAWSHYVGWEPWEFARASGILKKHADKNGIAINLVLVPDYVESVNQYSSGKYHGVAVTNMDALTMPAAGGLDSTALIIGDYSNGNDGVVLRNGKTCSDIKGRKVKIVELSVSHYLLSRMLSQCKLAERDVKVVNTSDSDISSAFQNDSDPKAAVVTWNPMLMDVRNAKQTTMVFDSSKTPEEILDLMVVRTDSPDTLKKALVGAWFETIAVLGKGGPERTKAVESMAKFAQTTPAQFEAQLRTTALYMTPADAATFAESQNLKKGMEFVRTFSFEHGLFGKGAKTKDEVGIQFPDGTTMGNPKNIKLRFDSKYMREAAK